MLVADVRAGLGPQHQLTLRAEATAARLKHAQPDGAAAGQAWSSGWASSWAWRTRTRSSGRPCSTRCAGKRESLMVACARSIFAVRWRVRVWPKGQRSNKSALDAVMQRALCTAYSIKVAQRLRWALRVHSRRACLPILDLGVVIGENFCAQLPVCPLYSTSVCVLSPYT